MQKRKGIVAIAVLALALVMALAMTACGGGSDVPTPPAVIEYTVTFSTDGGSAVSAQTIKENESAVEPNSPTKAGYRFKGWYKEASLTNAWSFTSDKVTADTTLYAKWAALYTVTFESNGGSAVASVTDVEDGSTVTKPSDPTRTGYTFGDWYKEAALTNAWSFATDTVTGNTTLYAEWRVNSYAVTYNSNGGSEVTGTQADYDTLLVKPADPTRDGYTFGGWYKEAACVTAWDFSTDKVTGATTLYAKWTENAADTYTVTFEVNGGSFVATQTIEEGGKVTEPTSPTKAHYTFGGWYKEDTYATAWSFGTDTVTESVTLYAKWTVESYAVTYDSNGGSEVAGMTVEYDKLVTEPTPPTRAGHRFDGWYKEAACVTAWDFASDKVTADTTLYAKWIALYTVTFETSGGSDVAAIPGVEDGQTISAPDAPTKEHYTFIGWYEDAELTSQWNFARFTVKEDTTLYAKWEAETYTVTYNTNGGSDITSTDAKYDTLLSKPTDPTKTGYTFAGWYKDAELTTEWDFATDKVTDNTELYAQWTINVYTVKYETNGGTEITDTEAEYNALLEEPADPTKDGYKFLGWYKDSEYKTAWEFATDKVTSDTKLHAKWVALYTVTFESNGGSDVAAIPGVEDGSKISAPDAPTREHYTFEGWYKDEAMKFAWDFDSAVTGNVTLYAKWEAVSYTVTYATDNGTTIAPTTAKYDTLVSKPSDPSKTGYTFAGWYKEDTFVNAWDFAADKVTGDTVLYAQWTVNSYDITYMPNNGDNASVIKADYGTALQKPSEPTRTGYTFAGWYKDAALTDAWDFASDTVTGTTTLYAQWTINSYTVTFEVNGGTAVASQTVVFDTFASKPDDPKKTGHTFVDWYRDAAFVYAYDFTSYSITGNTTIYAKWEINVYTVTFETDGGNKINDKKVEYNNTIGSAAPVKAGAEFGGWYTDAALTKAWDVAADKVVCDMTLYAKWDGPMVFTLSADETYYTLTEYKNNLYISGTTIEVPAEHEGLPVKAIGANCFEDCQATKITIPDGIETIGASAFYCSKLTSFDMPDSVTEIGEYAFASSQLASIRFSSNISVLPYRVLSDCPLKSFDIPESVTTIKNQAFSDSVGMLWIPKTVLFMEDSAYSNPNGALYVAYEENDLPTGWASSWYGFARTPIIYGIASKPAVQNDIVFEVENGSAAVSRYVGVAIDTCDIPKQVTIDNTKYDVKKIKTNAFSGVSDLSLLNLPEGLETIESKAFVSVREINIWIPSGVIDIAADAFSSIGYSFVFTSETSRPSGWLFEEDSTLEFYVNYNTVAPVIENEYLIGVVGGSVTLLKYYGNSTHPILPEKVTIGGAERDVTVLSGAFMYKHSVTSIIIPETYTEIVEAAFEGTYYLRYLYIPKSVKTVGDYLCDSSSIPHMLMTAYTEAEITTLNWPDGWYGEGIPMYGFEKTVTIDNVTYALQGDKAFCLRAVGSEVNIPGSITFESKEYKVDSVNNVCDPNIVTKLTLGEGITSLEDEAFEYNQLTELVLPSTLTSIGAAAIYGCGKLNSIVIPAAVTDIANSGIAGCDNLLIYIEAGSIPTTWADRWNSDNRPVYVLSADDPAGTALPAGVTGFWHYVNGQPEIW